MRAPAGGATLGAGTMSRSSRRGPAQQTPRHRVAAAGPRASRRSLLLGVAAAASAAGLGALALTRAGGDPGASAAAPAAAPGAAPVAVNLDADTVAFEREEIDLGRVPLDKVVPVSARLTNHSRRKVILTQATAQTLEGC